MVQNVILYVLLRLARVVVPLLPDTFVYQLGGLAGLVAYRLARGPRAAIHANLAVVLDLPSTHPEVRRCATAAFQNNARNWLDTLRIHRLSLEHIQGMVEVRGWDNLAAAQSAGHGVILVALHLGNFDFVGQILVGRGYRVTIPVEQMKPRALFELLVRERQSKGVNVLSVEHAGKEMVRAVRRGEIVAIAGDRNVGTACLDVPFFGRTTCLPLAAVSLARRTGAPLMVGFAVREPGERFRGYLLAPFELVHSRDAEADDRVNLTRLSKVLEDCIRQFPDQWLMFSPIWNGSPAPDAVASIEEPTGAVL